MTAQPIHKSRNRREARAGPYKSSHRVAGLHWRTAAIIASAAQEGKA